VLIISSRSAVQAGEIADRRLKMIEDRLEKLYQERK